MTPLEESYRRIHAIMADCNRRTDVMARICGVLADEVLAELIEQYCKQKFPELWEKA